MREHVICLIVLSLLSGVPAGADWSHDPTENNPICATDADLIGMRMVEDGTGGVILAWWHGSIPDLDDILLQHADPAGAVQWPPDGVSVGGAIVGGHTNIGLVSDGTGGAIVAWTDGRSGDAVVYAQRVDADGNVCWSTGGVPVSDGSGEQVFSDMAADGFGGAVICWRDRRWLNNDVRAQRIDGSGNLLWPGDGLMVCVEPSPQNSAKLLVNGSGGALFVWQDYRNGSDYHIYAQSVDAGGSVQWAPDGVAVHSAAGIQWPMAIESDGAGGAIIVWEDHRSGTADIYAQRIDTGGSTLWDTGGIVVCAEAEDQLRPELVSDTAGGVIVIWDDWRWLNADIRAQRIGPDGTLLWAPEGLMVCVEPSEQYIGSKLTVDGAGGAIVCWVDPRNGTENYDVFAQRVNAAGITLWQPDGISVCTAPGHQYSPKIETDGQGGAIIGWTDHRNGGDADLYAQQVDVDGLLGGPANQVPVAEASGSPLGGYPPLTVQFQSTSWDPDSDPIDHDWDFGDPDSPNNTSDEANPAHEFVNPGTYTVTLTVSDGTDEDSDPVTVSVWQPMVGALLVCVPGAGTVPFSTMMTLSLENLNTSYTRRVAGHIDVFLASGTSFFPNWRAGFTNIDPGASYDASWPVNIPALGSLIGANQFELHAMDVTPPPYNIFPFPPSGSTDSDTCVVYGIAP